MATVDEITSRPYARVLVPDESGRYSAKILELPGCFAEGDTAEEALEELEEAMRVWVEAALEDGFDIPEPEEWAKQRRRRGAAGV